MKITEAVAALKRGETINCADTSRTCTLYTDEGVKMVRAVRKGAEGERDDTNLLSLDRFQGLYERAVFGEGEYALDKPAEKQSAKAKSS